MTGDMQRVADRLAVDEDLRLLVRSAATPEQVVQVLADAGFVVGVEDVIVPASLQAQLSDEELMEVAGGTSPYVSVYVVCQPSPPSQHFVFGQCIP